MKKLLKIGLILTALALFSTACSKVRTTNLIGTYKSGSSTMSVSSDGYVNFSIASDATGVLLSLSKIAAYKYDSTGNQEYRNNVLVPWDLTSEKQSYDYSFETEKQVYIPSTDGSGYGTYKVNVSLNFTKDNETVNCKVTITVPEGKGESGSVTFSK
ncbi:hypothetical protein [Brachyspira murdochii]|uniref:Uncharacterized protein n=1 Tax=Brachyspira murdochii TaxID=84378 RepID=A0ABX5B3T8_9SPIR|nr:hypothetical protein [Brachyspira murdochii]PPS21974.1 hypothetical protein DJ52_07650 [Brachyspira murdochii]